LSTRVRNRIGAEEKLERYRDQLTREDLLEIYRRMWFARVFDETLYDMKKKGRLRRGNVYGSRGQEAIQVGTSYPLRPTDFVSPIHRDMPIFVFKGMSTRQVMCQIWGKANAPTRGKDSWSHMGDLKLGIIHSTSMLGSTIPVACGVAWALRLDGKTDSVVMTYLGEGATATGAFHEGMNYAAVHKLPIILIVENNQYAYSTPVELEVPTPRVADRALGYGIPGYSVDGNDVLEVYDATARAVERARRGEGPTLLECKTFRMTGHSAHDDAFYVPKELFEEWAAKDPIARLAEYLTTRGIATEAELQDVEARVTREVDEAVRWAEQSPYPDPEACLDDVYASPL